MKFFTLIFLGLVLILPLKSVQSQKYITRNGLVKLKYNAPHGKMETENNQVAVAFNSSTGDMQFNIVMLSFKFEGAYSQEKFDEYFKKNAHFANSIFKGKIVDFEKIDLNNKGEYEVLVKGNFTLRQNTHEISAKAKFTVGDNFLSGKSTFTVNLKDFNFNIPPSMEKNIQVIIDAKLHKMN